MKKESKGKGLLYEMRDKLKLSQEAMAQYLGCSRSTIAKAESNGDSFNGISEAYYDILHYTLQDIEQRKMSIDPPALLFTNYNKEIKKYNKEINYVEGALVNLYKRLEDFLTEYQFLSSRCGTQLIHPTDWALYERKAMENYMDTKVAIQKLEAKKAGLLSIRAKIEEFQKENISYLPLIKEKNENKTQTM